MFEVKADEIVLPDAATCVFDDLDLSQTASINAVTPSNGDWKDWHWFNNIGVSNECGTQLFLHSQPLRAHQIKVIVTDVGWRYGFSFATAVRSPLGRGTHVDADWRFPGLFRYGAVIYQLHEDSQTAIVYQLSESSLEAPQVINLNPDWDVFVNINDQKQAYHDNNGSLDLYLTVVA